MSALFVTSEIAESHVALVSEIGGGLQLFEARVPYSRILSVRVDGLCAHAGQHTTEGRAEGGSAAEERHLDARVRVTR